MSATITPDSTCAAKRWSGGTPASSGEPSVPQRRPAQSTSAPASSSIGQSCSTGLLALTTENAPPAAGVTTTVTSTWPSGAVTSPSRPCDSTSATVCIVGPVSVPAATRATASSPRGGARV